jgi:hypothetical protein
VSVRAATFAETAVELGGHEAPEVDRVAPMDLSRLVLWLVLFALVATVVALLIVAPAVVDALASAMAHPSVW